MEVTQLTDGRWHQLGTYAAVESTRKEVALPEDSMPPIGRLVQLPPIVQIAKHEFSFAEKPLTTVGGASASCGRCRKGNEDRH